METQAILEREVLQIPNTPEELLDETRRDLGARADEILGYKPLQQSPNVAASLHNKRTQLAKTFARLEIKPFTAGSVERYKKCEVRKHQDRKGSAILCITSGVIAVVGLIVVQSLLVNYKVPAPAIMALVGILAYLAVVIGSSLAMISAFWAVLPDRWSWSTVPIHRYTLPTIPDDVLETAIAVKKECPWVEMEIELLSLSNQVDDPFLVVRLDGGGGMERYHIAVWDEPGFKASFR